MVCVYDALGVLVYMKILAIETSCDETAMAFVECSSSEAGLPQFDIKAEIIASQIETHRPFGGVVPSLAKREHIKNLPVVLDQLKKCLNFKLETSLDYIAVTVGPGLEPALWTGINFAKGLAETVGVPLVGVNHLEGHIYSNWLSLPSPMFPAICLIVSGGHTILLRMDGMKQWEKLGETQDDAVGEAFDKVAKMLELPYPGGPEVEKQAGQIRGGDGLIPFPRPMLHSGNYNFSFSGLKTAVLYYLRDNPTPASSYFIPLICASFQQAAVDALMKKTMRAAEEYDAESVLLCGGVAANKALRESLRFGVSGLAGVSFHVPEMRYNTDNAVMIAAAAYLGHHYPTETADGNLNI